MNSRRKSLADCRLYLILDAGVVGYDELFVKMKMAVHSGVDIVQLRDKLGTSKETLQFCKRALGWLQGRIPFIVNDRVDIACVSGADGVHLGQDDIPVGQARKMLGTRKIIGKSCQTIAHVNAAVGEDVDYIGFGSVFKTLTKPERRPMDLLKLRAVAKRSAVPLFAIGGITRGNVGEVMACGISRVAVCREILLAKDIAFSVGEMKKALNVVVNQIITRE
jgi:thiamine-phosphate pyrophosphorylase